MILGDNMNGPREDALCAREYELARLIATTPCQRPWQALRKIDVLEYYLCGAERETCWTDNREFAMLAGIKADLRRFEPSDPKEAQARITRYSVRTRALRGGAVMTRSPGLETELSFVDGCLRD